MAIEVTDISGCPVSLDLTCFLFFSLFSLFLFSHKHTRMVGDDFVFQIRYLFNGDNPLLNCWTSLWFLSLTQMLHTWYTLPDWLPKRAHIQLLLRSQNTRHIHIINSWHRCHQSHYQHGFSLWRAVHGRIRSPCSENWLLHFPECCLSDCFSGCVCVCVCLCLCVLEVEWVMSGPWADSLFSAAVNHTHLWQKPSVQAFTLLSVFFIHFFMSSFLIRERKEFLF